jgi:predicted HTH domain antitoxin
MRQPHSYNTKLLWRFPGLLESLCSLGGDEIDAFGEDEKSMMNMMTVSVDLPRDLLGVLEVPESHVAQQVRELIAMELYREGRISAGKGAEMLGMPKRMFIQILAQHGLSYFTELPGELKEQVDNVDRLLAQRKIPT